PPKQVPEGTRVSQMGDAAREHCHLDSERLHLRKQHLPETTAACLPACSHQP
ncbi:hypothetical protein P7K49_013312, partial [Saguinus oedipus]